MREVTDTDEWCANCGKPVLSYRKKCPWCGKVWYIKNDGVCKKAVDSSVGKEADTEKACD